MNNYLEGINMITNDLVNKILIKPICEGADEFYAVAGYATPNMVSYFISSIPKDCQIKMHLIVGMTHHNGISMSVHEGFKYLMKNHTNKLAFFKCSYVFQNTPIGANMYMWSKNGKVIKAFGGSAGFTQSAFYLRHREIMFEINPLEAMAYYQSFVPDTIYANHNEIEEYVKIHSTHTVLDSENNVTNELESSSLPRVKLSLLTRNGETGTASGVNWGQRSGREPNQAYIHVPAKIRDQKFFPPPNTVFTALTDDKKCMIMRVEQEGDKAITTPSNNSLLGEYLRNRLNLANGQYIQREDLERYGRTDVTFYKLDENQYFMDFGV